MADNGSAQSQDTKMWPLPSFHFKVTLGSVGEISFSEVSGLETEFEEITYRAGDSNDFTKLKMEMDWQCEHEYHPTRKRNHQFAG